MPLETKKVLWTVLSVVIVLVVTSGVALALVYPRGADSGGPATVAAVAPPRSTSPDEYVRTVVPAPVPVPPDAATQPAGSDIIIVYGDKPAPAAIAGTAQPGTTATVSKPYTPAASSPVAPKPAAAQSTASAQSKPAAKPAAPKTVAEYWIQAAAFTSRSRADDLQRELASKGLSTLITVKDLDGITWYRVRIGPYPTEGEATGWLENIRKVAGCAEAYVSRQTVQRSG